MWRKKKRKRPRTEREILIAECDDLASIYIRRKHGECQRCGSVKWLQDSHIITRAKWATRWDLKNRFCLCMRCHIHWWHKADPFEVVDWALTLITMFFYRKLKLKSQKKVKWTEEKLRALKRKLKKKIDELEV